VVPEKLGEFRPIGTVLVDAQFNILAELLIELLVILCIFCDFLEQLEYFLDDILLDDL
jgi:hypothetical protein